MSLDIVPSDSLSDGSCALRAPAHPSSSSRRLESLILSSRSGLAQTQAYVGQTSAPGGRLAEKQVRASQPRAAGPTEAAARKNRQGRRVRLGRRTPGERKGSPSGRHRSLPRSVPSLGGDLF